MTTSILKIKSKLLNFTDSFGLILKSYLSVITVISVIDIVFDLPFIVKIDFFIISSLTLVLLLFVNIFSKLTSFLDLIKQKYKATNEYLFIFDLLILTGSLLLGIRFAENKILTKYDYLIILNIFSVWFITTLAFKNFFPQTNIYYWKFIYRYLKTHFILTYSVILLCLILEIENFLFLIISIIFYNSFNLILNTLRYFYLLPEKYSEERFSYLLPEEIQTITHNDNILFGSDTYKLRKNNISDEFEVKLKHFLNEYPKVFSLIKRVVDLTKINLAKSLIIRSSDIFNISKNDDNSLEFIMNLHQLNDQRRVNKYLIEVNKKLIDGGIFIGCFQNIRNRYKYFIKTYPYFLSQIFYFLDFIWARVFPKLPVLQGIYFNISKGKNRAISLAGGLGRFIYCGFDFVDVFDDDLLTYIIAVKKREPLKVTPSYGPIFAMRRVGKDGKEIKVLKFRTMHPYSEFLQSFLYKNNKLDDGGKFKSDFRITSWGRILRKYWLDELPMIYNLLKGDLKLVGVRPLSYHYFNLYPEEIKQLRIKTKPGLVPPYYYDMPKNFDEILNSELRYLERYFKNPIKTDIIYFFKAFYNILIKRARSK